MSDLNHQSTNEVQIVEATVDHVATIKSMVDAAYSKYIERLGKPPGPMMQDYHELLRSEKMYVLQAAGQVVGSIILTSDHESVKVNNVVVSPTAQGHGYGRMLMDYAETLARTQKLSKIALYTNVKMYENIEMYKKLGYTETGRRNEDGYDRVFFEKTLG